MIKSFTVISRVYSIFGMMKSLIILSLTYTRWYLV